MMGQSSYAPSAEAMAVISPQFCAPSPVDLTVTKKTFSKDYAVTNVDGNIVFKVEAKLLGLRYKRILLDAAGNPIVTFQQKALTAHSRWQVYRGDSTDSKDLLFSVKKASYIQMFQTQLDVFLASNTSEHTCDFHIKGSFFERSCTIYHGNSNVIVAQMSKRTTAKNIVLGKEAFGVTVYPNVDYAFIISLIVMQHIRRIKQRQTRMR